MKRILKYLFNQEKIQQTLCLLGAMYIRIVRYTGFWSVVRGNIPKSYWDAHKPFIAAIWHGRILMMPYCWATRKKGYMLVSKHRDGQLISSIIKKFGFQTIEASTNKGGEVGLRVILNVLGEGGYVGITPDGPRGPCMQASIGIVRVARMAGVPIIPVSFSVRQGKQLGTWDNFLLPWPFSSGVIVWGKPIEVSKDLDANDIEKKRFEVEKGLNAIVKEADQITGRKSIPTTAS